MVTPFPTLLFVGAGPVFPLIAPHYAEGSKISLNNTIKIRFIGRGERLIKHKM
jgi:hypothetical protein